MPPPSRSGQTSRVRTAWQASWLPEVFPLLLCGLPVAVLVFRSLLDPQEAGAFLETLARPRAWRTAFSGMSIALASCLAALAMGIPTGFLYARSGLPGRKAIRAVFSLPFILPPVLLVIAFTGFYGREGLLNQLLRPLGLPTASLLFGFSGIVLAQAFYNFPIVASLTADALESLDHGLEEAARLLGAGPLRRLISVSLPQILPAILASASLVFLLCVQSFAVLLLMGGGPRHTGFEVEIFRALRVDFDRGAALAYAFLETLVCLLIVLVHGSLARGTAFARLANSSNRRESHPSGSHFRALASIPFLAFLLLAVGGPLLALFIQAFRPMIRPGASAAFSLGNFASLLNGPSRNGFIASLGGSLALGLSSAAIATLLACASALLVDLRNIKKSPGILPLLPLAISPMVLALSLGNLWPGLEGFPAIMTFQALMALPFAYQGIRSSLGSVPPAMEEAARVLGASRFRSVLSVRLPLLSRPILSAFALAFAISLADIAGPLAFGDGRIRTLGLMAYRLCAAYRFDLAAAAGLILLALSATAFFLTEKSS